MKAKVLRSAKIQTKAVGLEGAPYTARAGREIEVTEAAYKKLCDIHGADAFELVETPKAVKKSARKGDAK